MFQLGLTVSRLQKTRKHDKIIKNLHDGESISQLVRDRSYPAKVLAKKFKEAQNKETGK